MKDDALTPRQREILEFIMSSTDKNGFQPSYRDIAKHFSISSTRAIKDHVDALQRKGFLEKTDTRGARKLAFTDRAKMQGKKILKQTAESLKASIRYLNLKHSYATLGSFSAVDDDDSADKASLAFDATLVKGQNTFLIQTKGDSMINAHIQDGDFILVNPDDLNPKNGDIVVARLDNSATVKRFYREGPDLIRLQPENETLKPIMVHPKQGDFEIVGKVVGVFRQM